ncbi:MAG: TonB-dependent receptor [Pseudomonadota bacterium]
MLKISTPLAHGTAALVTLLALLASPLAAQSHDTQTGGIVVEATLNDPARDNRTASKALGPDRLSLGGAVSVTEDLSLLTGVVAFENGGPGGGSYVSIRGGEPNFAIVTINGVRVDDSLNSSGGGFDFTLIEPELVRSLAVVSGPQSTTYGADALSGVIALELGARADSGTVYAGLGSEGRTRLGGSLGLSGKAGTATLAAGYSDSASLNPGRSNERLSVMAAASPNLGSTASLDLFALYAASDSIGFPEDSGGPELAVIRELEPREREQIALGGTFAAAISPQLTAQVRVGFSQSEFSSDNPGIASTGAAGALDPVPPIVTDSRLQRYEAVGSVEYRHGNWLILSTGASYTREDGVSDGTLDFGFLIPTAFALERDMPGLFVTLMAEPARGFEVSAGLRADWPKGSQMRWTPRIGTAIALGNSGLSLTASYAQGFKRPSLFALGFPLIANPDLEDERSETFDAGIAYGEAGDPLSASATYFSNTYRDLVDFDPELFTNVNRARVEVEGVEFAGTVRQGPISARAALTYQTAQSADGALLRFRPEWTGRLSVRWQASANLSLSAHGELVSSFNDSSVPTGFVRNPGFESLGFDASWAVTDQIELFGSLRNATDSTYARSVGFTEPGRNVFIGLRSRF